MLTKLFAVVSVKRPHYNSQQLYENKSELKYDLVIVHYCRDLAIANQVGL